MMETRKSFCRFCLCCCGIEVDVDTDQSRVVEIRGDRSSPHSRGYTCPRGRAVIEEVHHPERLLVAKKRQGDSWSDIPYSQALDEIAQKLQQIQEKSGPRSIAIFKGAPWNRLAQQFSNAWMKAIGSQSLFSSLSTDRPGIFVAGQRFFGTPNIPMGALGGVFDMEHAEVALLVGTNPVVSDGISVMPNPGTSKYLRDARKRGMKLIVIDPRRSETAKLSDLHLQVKPGEDASLMAAMVKVIIERKLYDQEYVTQYVSGLDEVYAAVIDFDLDYVSQRTQVSAELIVDAATTFAKAKTGAARIGIGLTMGRHANLTLHLINVLNALCGRIDRPGGLVTNPGVLRPPAPAMHTPVPQPLFSEEKPRIRGLASLLLAPGWSERPASTLADEILEPGEGRIRAFIVLGSNPVITVQDQVKLVKAMRDIELLVVIDPFMTATAKYAHYILPTKHFLERPEYTDQHDQLLEVPFAQYTRPVIPPPIDVPDDWEIFWELARRMKLELKVRGLPTDHKPTTDELLEGMFCDSRVPLEEIRKHPSGAIFGELEFGRTVPGGIAHPDRRMAAGHPDAIKELREVRAEPVISRGGYSENDNFTHRMVVVHLPGVFCSRGANLPSLKKRHGSNRVQLNPEDGKSMEVEEGDLIIVDSGYGKIKAVVEISAGIMSGTVGVGFGWGVAPEDEVDVREQGFSQNRLIPNDHLYDPVTGMALQTALPVNLYKQQ